MKTGTLTLGPVERDHLRTLQAWRNHPDTRAHVRETRYLTMADQNAWYERLHADPTVRFMTVRTVHHTVKFDVESMTSKGGYGPGTLVGLIGLTSIDWINRRAEVSVLSPEHAEECLTLLVDYAFNVLGLHRLEAEALTDARTTLVNSVGFRQGSPRHHAYWRNGQWIDSYVWERINSDADTRPETPDATSRQSPHAPA